MKRYEIDIESDSGTIVIWENIDQIKGKGIEKEEDHDNKIRKAQDHLRLTFHRFISSGLKMIVNYKHLDPLDPFLVGKSVAHSPHKIPIDEGSDEFIELQGFTLPTLSRLNQDQKEEVRLEGDLNQSQGFYIYRGNRLIKYGGWLGLKKYQALTNLSRVKVDVPNSLDEEWNTDIKKTKMQPPHRVMLQLRQLLDRFHDPSKKIHRRRATDQVEDVEMWQRFEKQSDIEESQTKVSYSIDVNAARYKEMLKVLDDHQKNQFLEFVKSIEDELPFQQIHIDVIDDKLT